MMGSWLLVLFIVGVLGAAAFGLFRGLRQRRMFAWFRVVDGTTKAPLAGASVYGLYGSSSYTRGGVVNYSENLQAVERHTTVKRKLLGTLDGNGAFQRLVGHGELGAFEIEAPGVSSGLVGVELVSDRVRFAAEPYVCQVERGIVTPPKKLSPVAQGLVAGQQQTRRSGYTNRYEAPALHDVVQCWATLEEAKKHGHGGGLDRYWKVEGVEVVSFDGGYQLQIESFERA